MNPEILTTGGISGAITNPYSDEALDHALLYYEEIRNFSTDVLKISQNTDFSYDQILMVKNYLFIYKHNINGELRLFDACFQIAESWKRLAFDKKNIRPHDILLLKHELMEIGLVKEGLSQQEAHNMSSKLYNYAKASDEYYEALSKSKNKHRSMNSGGIYFLGENTH